MDFWVWPLVQQRIKQADTAIVHTIIRLAKTMARMKVMGNIPAVAQHCTHLIMQQEAQLFDPARGIGPHTTLRHLFAELYAGELAADKIVTLWLALNRGRETLRAVLQDKQQAVRFSFGTRF